jgi:hypothetical protein
MEIIVVCVLWWNYVILVDGNVLWGQNHGKHVVRVGVRIRGLWWLGWTQEHKNHAETQRFILVWANSVPTSSS